MDDMVQHYSTLLSMIPKVTRNEGAEAIDSVLNAVSNSADFELLTRVYSITSQQLARMPDTERMLFNVDMKLCRSYIERHDYANAQRVLDRLHNTCKLPDGSDDRKNKGAELIEIYAAAHQDIVRDWRLAQDEGRTHRHTSPTYSQTVHTLGGLQFS